VVGSQLITVWVDIYQFLISGIVAPSEAEDAKAQGRERDLTRPEGRLDCRHRDTQLLKDILECTACGSL